MSITKESLTSARDAAILCANLACAVHAGIRSEAKPDVSEELRLLPDAVDKANSLLKETRLDAGTAHREALDMAFGITFALSSGLYPDPIAFLASRPYPDYWQLCERIEAEHNAKLDWLATIPTTDPAPPTEPTATPVAKSSKGSKAKKATVNSRMIDILGKEPESIGWTAMEWANRLGCSDAMITKTNAWKSLALQRETRKAENASEHARQKRRK